MNEFAVPSSGSASDVTRKNAASDDNPVASARSSVAANAAPWPRCENTASTLPRTGNTASNPLQREPTVSASPVTINVNAAPAAIRSTSSPEANGRDAAGGATAGNTQRAATTAITATASDTSGVAGSDASNVAATL